MRAVRELAYIMRADLLERTRRYSYLLTLGFVMYAAYLFVPPNDSNYTTLSVDGHRGIYNSAWIGTMVAMMSNAFLSLAGFYLIKNSVRRDIETGVGQILAASPLSKNKYLLGKWMSNLAVLVSILCLLAFAAVVMQLVRGEDTHLHLWKIAAPFLLVCLPMMAVVAALAILFESIALLSGGFGNVVFFFLWIFSLSPVGSEELDLFGFRESISIIKSSTASSFPNEKIKKENFNLGFSFKDGEETYHLSTFEWQGVDWSAAFLLRRCVWIAIAFGLIAVSGFFFRRFDESPSPRQLFRRSGRFKGNKKKEAGLLKTLTVEGADRARRAYAPLTAVAARSGRSRFGVMILSEFKLAVKGINRWWLLVAATLVVLSLTVPIEGVRQFVFPLCWVWPILLWSPMGSREKIHRTEQLIFSCAHTLRRQLLAMWCAGVLLAVLTGSGVAVRYLIAGEWPGLLAWGAGALFIPSLALATGVWSGSGKLFEIIFLLIWYIGPMNKFSGLDFLGSSEEATHSGHSLIFFAVSIILLSLAFVGRRRQSVQF